MAKRSFSGCANWLRRPQFSMRTFLLIITLVCAPLSFIGAIKYKAYTYRAAIADLQANAVEVRRIRTEDAAAPWQRFVETWIDNDAYAGDMVEVVVRGVDLTGSDIRKLNRFAAIRALELASPKLTDATLRELRQVNQTGALAIRSGEFTESGLASISEFKHLRSLDLTGIPFDDQCLSRIEPHFDVDELALNVNRLTPNALEKALANKGFQRLVLENRPPPSSLAKLGMESLPTFSCDFQLPQCEALVLTNFSLTDDALEQLGTRPHLKTLTLTNCRFDGGFALRLFASPGSQESARPVLRLGGFVQVPSEIGPEELHLLQQQPAVSNLAIAKLRQPSESVDLLLANKRLQTLDVPEDLPVADLIRLAKSADLISVGIYCPRKEGDRTDANGDPIPELVYRSHSIFNTLEKQGVDVQQVLREKAAAEKGRSLR